MVFRVTLHVGLWPFNVLADPLPESCPLVHLFRNRFEAVQRVCCLNQPWGSNGFIIKCRPNFSPQQPFFINPALNFVFCRFCLCSVLILWRVNKQTIYSSAVPPWGSQSIFSPVFPSNVDSCFLFTYLNTQILFDQTTVILCFISSSQKQLYNLHKSLCRNFS